MSLSGRPAGKGTRGCDYGSRVSRHTLHVTDVREGLDDLDWVALQGAYGSAAVVPSLVRRLVAPDADVRSAALTELWQTVWHQRTVYECSARVVPFLAEVAVSPSGDDGTRAQVVLLLASMASADSFVLPEEPLRMRRTAWLREPGDAASPRDLTVECRGAVAACTAMLLEGFSTTPSATRAALVAVLVAAPADSAATVAAWRTFEEDPDARLATAARVGQLLLRGSLTEAELLDCAAVDDETADYVASLGEWPLEVRAVEVVRELAERVVATRVR